MHYREPRSKAHGRHPVWYAAPSRPVRTVSVIGRANCFGELEEPSVNLQLPSFPSSHQLPSFPPSHLRLPSFPPSHQLPSLHQPPASFLPSVTPPVSFLPPPNYRFTSCLELWVWFRWLASAIWKQWHTKLVIWSQSCADEVAARKRLFEGKSDKIRNNEEGPKLALDKTIVKIFEQSSI